MTDKDLDQLIKDKEFYQFLEKTCQNWFFGREHAWYYARFLHGGTYGIHSWEELLSEAILKLMEPKVPGGKSHAFYISTIINHFKNAIRAGQTKKRSQFREYDTSEEDQLSIHGLNSVTEEEETG